MRICEAEMTMNSDSVVCFNRTHKVALSDEVTFEKKKKLMREGE